MSFAMDEHVRALDNGIVDQLLTVLFLKNDPLHAAAVGRETVELSSTKKESLQTSLWFNDAKLLLLRTATTTVISIATHAAQLLNGSNKPEEVCMVDPTTTLKAS